MLVGLASLDPPYNGLPANDRQKCLSFDGHRARASLGDKIAPGADGTSRRTASSGPSGRSAVGRPLLAACRMLDSSRRAMPVAPELFPAHAAGQPWFEVQA